MKEFMWLRDTVQMHGRPMAPGMPQWQLKPVPSWGGGLRIQNRDATERVAQMHPGHAQGFPVTIGRQRINFELRTTVLLMDSNVDTIVAETVAGPLHQSPDKRSP